MGAREVIVSTAGVASYAQRSGPGGPGSPGFISHAHLGAPRLTAGSVYIANTTSSGQTLYRTTNGVTEALLVAGQTLPGLPSVRLLPNITPFYNLVAQGRSVAGTALTGAGASGTELFRIDGVQSTIIANQATVAPGTDGQPFRASGARNTTMGRSVVMNRSGDVFFSASLHANGAGQTEYTSGIWRSSVEAGTGQHRVDPLVLFSGVNSGVNRPVSGAISVNAQGDVGFSDGSALYVHRQSDGVTERRTVGELAGITSLGSSTSPLINNAQQLVTITQTSTWLGLGVGYASGSAMVMLDGTSTREIVRTGMTLPDAGQFRIASFVGPSDGAIPNQFNVASSDQGPLGYAINNLGQVVMMVNVRDTQSGLPINQRALLAWDPQGGLVTLAIESEPLPRPGAWSGDVLFLNWVGGSNGMDGRSIGLNDDGVVTFSAGVGTGAGVFTVTIPAPGAAVAFAGAVLVIGRRRRELPLS